MGTKTPGIYRIKNLTNGKVYIGSAAHIPRRLWVHGWMLKRGQHHNVMLQRSWDRDGEAAFVFEAVEVVEDAAARATTINAEQVSRADCSRSNARVRGLGETRGFFLCGTVETLPRHCLCSRNRYCPAEHPTGSRVVTRRRSNIGG